jgi:hypothetical protein
MKTPEFAETMQKGASSQIPGMVKDMTVREVLNHPLYGGMAKGQLGPALDKVGITPRQFQDALKEGPPKVGKRSDFGTSGSTEFSSRNRTLAPPGLDRPVEGTPPVARPAEGVPPSPQGAQQPTVTPEMAEAIQNAMQEQAAPPAMPAIPPEAQPVLPPEPIQMPGQPGGGGPGGLSLAPVGLQQGGVGGSAAFMPGASQGGSIAMAGMLPPIQNSTFSTPLLDSMASTPGGGSSAFNAGSFMPISLDMMGGLGWGGGFGSGLSGGGFDFGGGGGLDFGGGGGMSMPMTGMGGLFSG